MLFRRPGGTFNFRRSVPPRLRTVVGRSEFVASLHTASRTLARARAGRLYEVTETIFTAARAATVVKIEGGEQPDATWKDVADVAEAIIGEQKDLLAQLEANIAQQKQTFELQVAVIRLQEAQERSKIVALLPRATVVMQTMMSELDAMTGRLSEARESRSDAARLVEILASAIASSRAVPAVAATPSGPLFSEAAAAFITARHDYTDQTRAQAGATLRLWVEVMGDGRVGSYAGADAGRFLDTIRRLPSSHGKSRTGQLAIDAIDAADKKEAAGNQVPRLTEKTVKRHASTLSQLWVYLKPLDHVQRNIFEGFRFPGTKTSKSKRSDWSPESLQILFEHPWKSRSISVQTYRWLVTIAMFTGMRLEEICRLRPGLDIIQIDGKWVFIIQEHPDGWTPKSEAGERAVPVHPELVRAGLLRHHERMVRAGAERLFHDLAPRGPGGHLGYEFSREFSKHKVAAGVPSDTVFHSFRHSVSTILRNADAAIRSEWIDGVLGHEGGQKSQGATTYLKRIGVSNLVKTVRAIEYPGINIALDFDIKDAGVI